jgi:predicted ATPase
MNHRLLNIKRFKCFESIAIRIDNLTVLTGKNSSGKSTVTQAIRLLREVAITHENPAQIHLNSSGFNLGTFDEVFNRNVIRIDSDSDNFEIGISETDSDQDLVSFKPAEDSDECEYVQFDYCAIPLLSNQSSCYFTYLSAERYGPRLRQEITDGHRSAKLGVGLKGEFSAEVLVNSYNTRIDENLIHPSLTAGTGKSNARLDSNLEKWMSTIVGDINIRASRPPRLSLPILEFLKGGAESEWQFPTNHGYGVSYTLPVVLAGLLLEENGILIVDTPEAHLHPAAQTALALFLARVAAFGRMVIIETHSEHIIDGFRLAIADQNHPLTVENCVFHYLDREERGSTIHHELVVRSNGSLPKWPKGFFDQTATNLRALSQLARK